jgi:hypothetical protein
MEVSGQLHAPAALPPGKSLRYPSNKRRGEPQSRSGLHVEEKILDPTGTSTPTPRSSSQPYNPVKVNRHFGGTYRFHLLGVCIMLVSCFTLSSTLRSINPFVIQAKSSGCRKQGEIHLWVPDGHLSVYGSAALCWTLVAISVS